MTDKFVIVIEVDNNRAAAAYDRGLQQLDRIWPRVLEYAERMDKSANEQWEIGDKYMAHLSRNREDGIPPPKLSPEHSAIVAKLQTGTVIRNGYLNMYTGMRKDLINMVRLAAAAVSPFRMTEHQVRAMLGWGDGTRVESILAEIERAA